MTLSFELSLLSAENSAPPLFSVLADEADPILFSFSNIGSAYYYMATVVPGICTFLRFDCTVFGLS